MQDHDVSHSDCNHRLIPVPLAEPVPKVISLLVGEPSACMTSCNQHSHVNFIMLRVVFVVLLQIHIAASDAIEDFVGVHLRWLVLKISGNEL